MPFLKSPNGLLLPFSGPGGSALVSSPPNIAAPAIVTPNADLLFNMSSARPGVPAVNDQFENITASRDWASCFNNTDHGFAGIRWQPTWLRAEGFYGSWEPATATIYRVQRKGATGQAAQTLVFTCGPNTASIPVGDKVVIWRSDYQGDVRPLSSLDLSGYSLPLRSKMTVTACTPSAAYDPDGRRIIEVDAGTALPAIDHTPSYVGADYYETTNLNLRHWSFYKDASTKALRHPLGWFTDISLSNIVPNGGYVMLGGAQFVPTYIDWSDEYVHFGATLIEDLYRQEAQGLADYFGDSDPRKVAVELENEPVRNWAAGSDGPGFGTLLRDVYYPIARAAWGPSRTIVFKASSFGSLDSLLGDFDLANPDGGNNHLAIHNYDGQISWPNGKINFGTITSTNWIADQLSAKIAALGYKGGGMTEVGAAPFEFYDGSVPVDDPERGRRLGRVLTSLTGKGLYAWLWGATGDYYRCAGIETIGGKNIEAMYSTMAPYGRRAGLTIA